MPEDDSQVEPSPYPYLTVLVSQTHPGATPTNFDVLLAHNDSLEFLKSVPSDSARLVVSSPPYNIGKPYEQRTELDKYLEYQLAVLKECVRILQYNGSLCWEVGNHVDGREVFPLDVFFYRILKEQLKLKLRNRIVWSFEHGLHASKRFSGRYEVILWLTKEDEFVFNLDPVRVPQKYPGKRYFKGPKRGEYSGNPLGKNPGDIWSLVESEWEAQIWDIPNVKWNHPEKTVHPAQFPIELVERLVLALTHPGDIVLDPFMGAGTSLVAAILHDRKAIGVDNQEAYVRLARERVTAFCNGSLRRRPVGTAKYEPNGNEKVAQRPREWPGSNSSIEANVGQGDPAVAP
jgi:DNA modification methylase